MSSATHAHNTTLHDAFTWEKQTTTLSERLRNSSWCCCFYLRRFTRYRRRRRYLTQTHSWSSVSVAEGEIRATTTERNVTQWRCAVDRCVTSQRVWSRIDINTFFQLSCPRSKTHKTQLKHDCTSSFFSKRLLYLKYTPKKSHHVRSNHSSFHVTWFTQECVFLHANRMFYIHNPEHDMYQQLLSG